MTKSRFGLVWALGLLVVLLLIGGVAFFVLRRGAQTQHVIELTPDIRLRLAGVLTKKNPELRLYNGGVQVSETIAKWRTVQIANKYLPDWAKLKPGLVNSFGNIKAYSIRLVYAAEFPKSWVRSRDADDIMEEIRKAIDNKNIHSSRFKISDGNYSPWVPINNPTSSGCGTLPAKYIIEHPYLTVSLDWIPVSYQKIEVELGSERYDKKLNRSILTTPTVISISNPLYQKITPLEHAQPLPATQRHGDIEVTLQALVARVGYANPIRHRERFELIDGKAFPVTGPIPADYFPLGKADDPNGLRSVAIMQVSRNGTPDTEWSLISPTITYSNSDIPAPAPMGSNPVFINNYWTCSIPMDLTVLSQPLKVTAQLKHVKNLLPDEEQTLELPLPKEGELVDAKGELAIWNRRVKIFGVGYKTTQSLESVTGVGKVGYINPRDLDLMAKSLVLISSDETAPYFDDVKLIGADGESRAVSRFSNSVFLSGTDVRTFDLEAVPMESIKREKPFRYSDYTTLSLTLRDGMTSPVLYEFVATPRIATGAGASGKPAVVGEVVGAK